MKSNFRHYNMDGNVIPQGEIRVGFLKPPMVGRCKLDPSLKATCFQPLNLRMHTVLST